MAFKASDMALIAHGNNKKLYAYVSASDAIATILGAAYFDGFFDQLDIGDLIVTQDSGNQVAVVRVTASSAAGVTVSYVTGWAQQAAIASLTDSTGGTANDVLADVGASFSQVTLNDNFADLAAKVGGILTALRTVGIIAP